MTDPSPVALQAARDLLKHEPEDVRVQVAEALWQLGYAAGRMSRGEPRSWTMVRIPSDVDEVSDHDELGWRRVGDMWEHRTAPTAAAPQGWLWDSLTESDLFAKHGPTLREVMPS